MSDLHINVGERFIADETLDSALVKFVHVLLVLGDALDVVLDLGVLAGVQLDGELLLEAELLAGGDLGHGLVEDLAAEEDVAHVGLLLAGSHELEPGPELAGVQESSNPRGGDQDLSKQWGIISDIPSSVGR